MPYYPTCISLPTHGAHSVATSCIKPKTERSSATRSSGTLVAKAIAGIMQVSRVGLSQILDLDLGCLVKTSPSPTCRGHPLTLLGGISRTRIRIVITRLITTHEPASTDFHGEKHHGHALHVADQVSELHA